MKHIPTFEKFLNESKEISVSNYKAGDVISFNDGEDWKVIKVKSNVDKLVIKPHNDKAKKGNTSLEIEIDSDYLKDNIKESVNKNLTEDFDVSKMKVKDTIELKNSRTGDTGTYTIKRILGSSSNIKEIEVLNRSKQPLTLYYSKEAGLQNFKGDVYESANEEQLSVIDYDEFVNPDKVKITLSNKLKLEIEKKRVQGGATTYQAILQSLDAYNDNPKAKLFIDNLVNAMAKQLS